MTTNSSSINAKADPLLREIADYVIDYHIDSDTAYDTAIYCLLDARWAVRWPLSTTRHAFSVSAPECPVPILPGGVRVPGTGFELDPIRATFNLGCMVH